MEFFSIAITVLAAILTYQTWKNGRWMKQSHEDTLALLERIEKGQERIGKGQEEARKEFAEALREIRHMNEEARML